MAQHEQSTITVPGNGVQSAVADTATVRLRVQVTRPTAVAARDDAASATKAVFAAIHQLEAVPAEDVSTSAVQVQPEYSYDQETHRQNITGYTFSNTIVVTLASLTDSLLAALLEAAVEAGRDDLQVEGVQFSLSPPLSYRLAVAARKQASEDAQATAGQYAEHFGASLGRVISITDASTQATPLPPAGPPAAARTMKVSGGTPVALGRLDVHAAIIAKLALQPGPEQRAGGS